jgi:hypothetical protein
MTGCPPEMRVTRASGAASRKLDAAAVLTGLLLPAPLAGLTGLSSPPGRAAIAGGHRDRLTITTTARPQTPSGTPPGGVWGTSHSQLLQPENEPSHACESRTGLARRTRPDVIVRSFPHHVLTA